MSDPKRRVIMRSVVAMPDGGVATHEATDYVPESILGAYVRDARSRWQVVVVSDEPDHGPGGEDGDTDHEVHLRDLTEA